jgi:hypothetical protein
MFSIDLYSYPCKNKSFMMSNAHKNESKCVKCAV